MLSYILHKRLAVCPIFSPRLLVSVGVVPTIAAAHALLNVPASATVQYDPDVTAGTDAGLYRARKCWY